jgi:hypothetical protein
VERLQEMLLEHGAAGVGEEARFGRATERSLRAFQRGRGLPATGETDAATWCALSAAAPEGGARARVAAGVAGVQPPHGGLRLGAEPVSAEP